MATGMKEFGSRRRSNVLPASCRKTYARPSTGLILTITKTQVETRACQPIPAYSGECPLSRVPRSVLRKITKRTHFNTADSLRATSNPSAINLGHAGFTLGHLRTGISGHSCPFVPDRARSWAK